MKSDLSGQCLCSVGIKCGDEEQTPAAPLCSSLLQASLTNQSLQPSRPASPSEINLSYYTDTEPEFTLICWRAVMFQQVRQIEMIRCRAGGEVGSKQSSSSTEKTRTAARTSSADY